MPLQLMVASLLLFTLFCFPSVRAQVLALNSSSFDQLVTRESGVWLIEFYASWCKPCQAFAPIYDKIATALSGNINVAKVDIHAPTNRNLGIRFEIEAFPSFKLIHNGYVFTYQGPITQDDLLAFANGGYKLYQALPAPGPPGLFGDIIRVYKVSYNYAWDDLKSGKLFTLNVFVSATPILLICIITIGN